jgi:hypothetical protein
VIAVSAVPIDPADAELFAEVLPKPYAFERLLRAVRGVGGRRRTRSGVFARALMSPPGSPPAWGASPRRAARALRDRGG